MHDGDRRVNADERSGNGYADGAKVHRQLKDQKFPNTFENRASVQHGVRDGCRIIVCDDNITGFFGNGGAAAHGETDVCELEGRRIVDAVSGHARDESSGLCRLNQPHFVCWQCPRHNGELGQILDKLTL